MLGPLQAIRVTLVVKQSRRLINSAKSCADEHKQSLRLSQLAVSAADDFED